VAEPNVLAQKLQQRTQDDLSHQLRAGFMLGFGEEVMFNRYFDHAK
jgi:hypothetical protein